jgi:CheY-like chemotaxis protein
MQETDHTKFTEATTTTKATTTTETTTTTEVTTTTKTTQTIEVAGAILVIDDEPAIREVMKDIFTAVTRSDVHTAANGHEGLQILQKHQNIALIFLDMNMPSMNGEETYKKLRQIAPDVRVIIASSLNATEVASRLGKHKAPSHILQKPFNMSTLLNVVQSESVA